VSAAVVDAGPLIHLYEVGALHHLAIFTMLHVPSEIWRETVGQQRVPESALHDHGVRRESYLDDLAHFVETNNLGALHPGEQECLRACHRGHISILLTDDLAARDAAKRLAITPVGSLGIIVRAYRVGRLELNEAESAIRLLQTTSSLFVTSTIIELALEQVRRAK
jgi:predicted nucleic acid-binding protein